MWAEMEEKYYDLFYPEIKATERVALRAAEVAALRGAMEEWNAAAVAREEKK